jgi:hypothetical protein
MGAWEGMWRRMHGEAGRSAFGFKHKHSHAARRSCPPPPSPRLPGCCCRLQAVLFRRPRRSSLSDETLRRRCRCPLCRCRSAAAAWGCSCSRALPHSHSWLFLGGGASCVLRLRELATGKARGAQCTKAHNPPSLRKWVVNEKDARY